MRIRSVALAFLTGTLSILAHGQGEELRPLTARPVPEALVGMEKAEGLNTHFTYLTAPQPIPLADDFSVDRTRKRWAQVGDADATLTGTVYRLETMGISTPDMVYSLDTTFSFVTDMTDPPVTTRTALPETTVLVRDVTVVPPTETVVQAWPPYFIFDTIQSPSPDTVWFTMPDLVQDSLLYYEVAADPRTYTRPDNSIVPLVLWEDDDVYINGTYPIDPPTIGVATFDGLSRTGYPYDFPNYSAYGIADHLTSVPIQLQSLPEDSVYLSFFYQPQGLSGDDQVQPRDSLVLEFYAPNEDLWYRVWRTPYIPLTDFQQVLIPITQTRFLRDGFRMRFINYASLSGSFDHWHLDYVRLGAQRTFDDTRLIDVAYLYPEASLLQTYTSVQFTKFQQAPASYMANSITAQQRNLDNVDRFITYGFLAKEENDATVFTRNSGNNTSGNASSIFPSVHTINPGGSPPPPAIYDPSLSTDAAFWRVKLWTNATPDINRYNDTVTFIQEISNYMAYDDGSAEMGYGLTFAGARLAYRFDMVGGDSLRAIRMYFNPQNNEPLISPPPYTGSFLITIWRSLSPVDVQHQNFTFSTPEYKVDGLNRFVEYPLDSTIYVEGTFYVGWTQTNAVSMNLGLDSNRNNQNKIFFSTTSGFENTTFEGSLMMRPVFVAAVDPFAGLDEEVSPENTLALFPNPANDGFAIRLKNSPPSGTVVQGLDATGRLVQQWTWREQGVYAADGLDDGVYILRVIDPQGRSLGQSRLIIQR